jgi:hypothetical protein
MFAQAMFIATLPLRLVNADIPSCDYVDACAPRASRARRIERGICAPDAQKPICFGRSLRPAARAAVRSTGCARPKRARPERAVCRGDEE